MSSEVKLLKNSTEELADIVITSTLGKVQIVATAKGVCRMEFAERVRRLKPGKTDASTADKAAAKRHVERAAKQIQEYFAGRRSEFDLALDLRGTELQLRFWKLLVEIPFGKTLTYGELARRAGLKDGARAAGGACGSNPVWLVVPCHRVVGSTGSLQGYGGGLWRKKALLDLEQGKQQLFPTR